MPSFSSRRAAGVPAGTVVTGRPERSVMRVTGAVVKAQTFFFRSSESGRSFTRRSESASAESVRPLSTVMPPLVSAVTSKSFVCGSGA